MAMLLTLSEVSDVWHKNILKVAFNLLFTAFILDLNSVFQHCAHFTFALFKEEGTGVLFQSNYLNSHFFAAGHCYCMIFRQSFCSQKSTQRVNSTLAEPNQQFVFLVLILKLFQPPLQHPVSKKNNKKQNNILFIQL